MSKVAIQGNASGTGTLTIAAPSTNTDRTLTLPDEAGTVLTSGGAIDVSASAPADSVVIDSSGNVGVGTSSPNQKQTIASGSGTSAATTYWGNGVTNTGEFYVGHGNAAEAYLFNRSNKELILGTNNTERMRIDSAGRVSMPYKPMFMAYPTTDYSGGSMPSGVIDMTVLYDNGTNFTAANDRFTAPVTGWYRVTWGGLQLSSTVTSLMVNGTRAYSGSHYVGAGAAYVTVTQTVIRYLNQSDFLNIEGWNGGGYYSGWYLWTVEHIG